MCLHPGPVKVPESLTEKMRLFRHRGHIEKYKDGLFSSPSWLSVYLGQGLRPERYQALADAEPIDRLIAELDSLRSDISDRIDEMPKHESFIARYANANAPSDALLHEAEARL